MNTSFHRKVLKNGMTLILEKRDLPVVSAAFAVRSGGVNEKPSEKGISHFIEHMLYKGTPSRNAKKIAEEIEKKGGELNGFTSEEITAYWCKVPSKYLYDSLNVLSDMIKNPLFDEIDFEKERKVIFEEIKMYRDNPRLHSVDEIQKLMYDGTMNINLAGTFDTMNSISREKMIKRFKETYTPNNLILCVVGNADFDKLTKFVEKNFDNSKSKISTEKFDIKRGFKIEKREGIDQANLVFAYPTPLAQDKKRYSAVVLNTLMTGGMSSRLFHEIREKRNLAYAVKGDANINKNFSYNIIYVGTMKENIDKVRKLILQELKKITDSLTKKEMDQIKEQLVGNYYLSMEDSQEQMVNLLAYEIQGNAKEFYNFKKDILGVKLEDVKNLAKNALKNYSFFALVPK